MLNEEELGECSSEYCTCKQNLPGTVTVKCSFDGCRHGHWFHPICVGLDSEAEVDGKDWFCMEECEKDSRRKGASKKGMVTSESDMDGVREYGMAVIWGGLSDMIRHNAIRENDGENDPPLEVRPAPLHS